MTAGPFAENLIHFARYLRARGLAVVPQTSADLLEAAHLVGLTDRDDLYHALRAVAVTSRDDLPTFDEAFDRFFGPAEHRAPSEIELNVHPHQPKVVTGMSRRPEGDTDGDDTTEDLREQAGASAVERLAGKDFGDMTAEEAAEVRRLIASMRWQPADAATRRWVPDRRGTRPDMRRTLRHMVGHEADLMPLSLSSRKPRRRPLLVLADVSGSMERYTEMFLQFIHGAHGRLGRVEAFVFSTHLTRITTALRQRDPERALRAVADTVPDWSGGTRIGAAIETFNRDWSRRVTRGGPVALIISDGWDTGDPALLEREMDRLRRSVHRVMWLNPLAGRPGFAPETRGMRAALPYVDDFLPAGRLVDLQQVVALLESVPGRKGGRRHLGSNIPVSTAPTGPASRAS